MKYSNLSANNIISRFFGLLGLFDAVRVRVRVRVRLVFRKITNDFVRSDSRKITEEHLLIDKDALALLTAVFRDYSDGEKL